ncbi:MAG: phosphatidylglycerophosphatase A [Magnetococcales bacterium]|nr:phosphatidylglycerophosphatase A [Magnetococcales bacterium]
MTAQRTSPTTILALIVATMGGAGLFPKAPGTMGTLVTVPLFMLLAVQGGMWAVIGVMVLLTLVGVWATQRACTYWGAKDPGKVVVDEAVGYLLTVFWLPPDWVWAMVGFALFRVFDIAKPGLVGWADTRIPGAWGVMIDDLVAGLYAGVSLAVLYGISIYMGWIQG